MAADPSWVVHCSPGPGELCLAVKSADAIICLIWNRPSVAEWSDWRVKLSSAKDQLREQLAEMAPGWPVADEGQTRRQYLQQAREQAKNSVKTWRGWEPKLIDGFLRASALALDLADSVDKLANVDRRTFKKVSHGAPAGMRQTLSLVPEAIRGFLVNCSYRVPKDRLKKARQLLLPAFIAAEQAWADYNVLLRAGAATAELGAVVLSGGMPLSDTGETFHRGGKIQKPAESEAPAARYFGDRHIQIDGSPPFTLTESEAKVLEALLRLGGTASKDSLCDESSRASAHRILGKMTTRYPELGPYVFMPGPERRGGYRTSILDAPAIRN